MNYFKVGVIVLRIALGGLFIYGGSQKFVSEPPRPQSETTADIPEHVVKIKAYIGGLKQTGYFWPMLGITEVICGVLLVSQYLALLGAVMLLPVTLNIFLFHLFLEPHEPGELAMTAFYLLANAMIIAYHFPELKKVFLNFKLT